MWHAAVHIDFLRECSACKIERTGFVIWITLIIIMISSDLLDSTDGIAWQIWCRDCLINDDSEFLTFIHIFVCPKNYHLSIHRTKTASVDGVATSIKRAWAHHRCWNEMVLCAKVLENYYIYTLRLCVADVGLFLFHFYHTSSINLDVELRPLIRYFFFLYKLYARMIQHASMSAWRKKN